MKIPTENKFSTDLPTLRTELTAILAKPGVLKRALDMETILDDLLMVVIWLGVLIVLVVMAFQGRLIFGYSDIDAARLKSYFNVLALMVTMFAAKPLALIWEAAILIKLGLIFRRGAVRRSLLAALQRDPATLQVGCAYSINAENAVIIRQTVASRSFQQTLKTLPSKQQQQWQKITNQRVKASSGDYKATGYDAGAIKQFIQTNLPDEFVFVDVLLQQFSKPFYWPVQPKDNEVVFYFQHGHRLNYLLHNFDASGTKRKGVTVRLVQHLFKHK